MVRSVHLAFCPIRFTDFSVLDRFSYEKIRTASLGTARWADLSTRHHIKPSPTRLGLDVVTSAEISPSRLPNDAVCNNTYFTHCDSLAVRYPFSHRYITIRSDPRDWIYPDGVLHLTIQVQIHFILSDAKL